MERFSHISKFWNSHLRKYSSTNPDSILMKKVSEFSVKRWWDRTVWRCFFAKIVRKLKFSASTDFNEDLCLVVFWVADHEVKIPKLFGIRANFLVFQYTQIRPKIVRQGRPGRPGPKNWNGADLNFSMSLYFIRGTPKIVFHWNWTRAD